MKSVLRVIALLVVAFVMGACKPTADGGDNSGGSNAGTEPPALVVYTVTFDSMGGSEFEAVKVAKGQTANLPIPDLAGKTFEGWYKEQTFQTLVNMLTPITASMELYAKWGNANLPAEYYVRVGNAYTVGGLPQSYKGDVVISSIYNGFPVTTIGRGAFYHCGGVTSISLPDTITTIESQAFAMSGIKSITLPEGITNIPYRAFFQCDSLTEISIPSTVKNIGEAAFYSCDLLNSITLPDGLESIGNSGLASTGITTLNIPEKLSSLGGAAVAYNDNLVSFSVDGKNSNFKTIDGNLYTINGETLIQYALGKTETSFSVPKGVKIIGVQVFQLSKLTSLTIGNDVEELKETAVFNALELKTITLGNNVKILGRSSIGSNPKLVTINIGSGLETIAWGALSGNDVLQNINVDENNNTFASMDGSLYSKDKKTFIRYASGSQGSTFNIPSNVEHIERGAFQNTERVEEVIIGEKVVSIGSYVFAYSQLKKITIPSSVVTIEQGAFAGCNYLREVVTPYTKENYPEGWVPEDNNYMLEYLQ